MEKDFNAWNVEKKKIDTKIITIKYYYSNEIWWCALGLNIGIETNGKHQIFERPVLILKKFNNNHFWGIPLTSKRKDSRYYIKIVSGNEDVWAILSQLKAFSANRLIRKIGKISNEELKLIRLRISSLINEC